MASGKLLEAVDVFDMFTESDADREARRAAEESIDFQRENLRRARGVDLPDYEKMQAYIDELFAAGELPPEYIPEILARSAVQDVQTDEAVKVAQMRALEGLREAGRVGFGEADLQASRELQRQTGAQERARQESILQQQAQRGALDPQSRMLARRQMAQAEANRRAAESDRLIAGGEALRRQAVDNISQAASGFRGQEFSEAAKRAEAADVVAKRGVQQRNLAQEQRIAQQRQQQEQKRQAKAFEAGLEQQKFEDRMQKAGMSSQAGGQMAGSAMQMASQQAQAAAARKQGAMQTGMSIAGLVASDKNNKTDIEPMSAETIIPKLENMLESLKAYRYKYKDEDKYGEGEQVGIMAQDLEKSDLGDEFVEDTENGKMVDYGKMAPTLAAGLAEIYRRVKKLEKGQ